MKITKKTVDVEKTVKKTVKEKVFTLEVNQEELDILFTAIGNATSDDAWDIYQALDKVRK